MGHRTFVDRNGNGWQIRPVTKAKWEFLPEPHNSERPRTVSAPSHERDPFELSKEELQALLDSAPPPSTRSKPSPFLD